jgi:hypothetical protein
MLVFNRLRVKTHEWVTTVETRQIIRNSNKLRDILSRSVKTELTINRYKINSRIPPTQFGGFSVSLYSYICAATVPRK